MSSKKGSRDTTWAVDHQRGKKKENVSASKKKYFELMGNYISNEFFSYIVHCAAIIFSLRVDKNILEED